MDDRGFVTPAVLVVLVAGVIMVGLAIDVARFASAWREAAHIADTASEAGAAMVDPDRLYRGQIQLDLSAAREVVESITDGHRADHIVTYNRVCVIVEAQVDPWILGVVGAASKSLRASACASPAQG